jgi:hypothetical protein
LEKEALELKVHATRLISRAYSLLLILPVVTDILPPKI